jgi:TonB family protein
MRAWEAAMSNPNAFDMYDGVQLTSAHSAGPAAEATADYGEAVTYQLAPTAPPLDPAEIDSADSAVEVVVMWGELSILHVEHLSPPRSFYVGEAADHGGQLATDFLIGRELLGVERLPIAIEANGGTAIVLPQGATGDVSTADGSITFEELSTRGRLQPCPELAGALQYTLPPGATGRVHHSGFTFILKPTTAARRIGVARASRLDLQDSAWIGASVVFHVGLLLSFYLLPPRSPRLALDVLNADSRLVQYELEPPQTDDAKTPQWLNDVAKADGGKSGKAHDGDEGTMGKDHEKKTDNRYAVKGPADNEDPHLSREQAIEMAMKAGIIGVMRSSVGSWSSPTSPYGRETALGNDPASALGALLGDQIGLNAGFGGLGPRGVGHGGGGHAEGSIGIGKLGTLGHDGCCGSGFGRGAGGLRNRQPKPGPFIRSEHADIHGSLSREVIRRIIHRHVNEVRYCYAQELNARPDLQGRVAVKFIIAPTGAVQAAALASSTLGNSKVEQCVVDAVGRWLFPAPEGGGIVVVTYPFVLEQTGS